MGLCKCPKKKVTNLFCFVHRVNVCEDCMIEDHSRCVVRSYLQWLQDSDYEPVCILCNQSLKDGEILRLCCLDLFHIACLDKYVQSSVSGGSVVSIKCPSCKDAFFPSNNMVSPVSNKMRETVKEFWWGREGLGLAPEEYYEEQEEEIEIMTNTTTDNLPLEPHLTSTPMAVTTRDTYDIKSHDNHVTQLQLYDQHLPLVKTSGDHTANDMHRHSRYTGYIAAGGGINPPIQAGYVPIDVNDDADKKYTKKSPLQSVSRWYRNHTAWSTSTDDSGVAMKRCVVFAFLVFLFCVTLIVLLTRVGQTNTEAEHDHGNWDHSDTNLQHSR